MTNPYYNPTGAPAQGSAVTSAVVRTEFAAIQAGFDKMPVLAGNAYEILRVKGDESGFEASGLVVDSSGRLLVGDTTLPSGVTVLNELLSTDSASGYNLFLRKCYTGVNSAGLGLAKSRGTAAAPVIVATSDTLGSFSFLGYDGVNYTQSAAISCVVGAAPSAGIVPGRVSISVADTTGSVLERFAISHDGIVTLGGNSTAPALKVNAYTAGNWVTISSGTNPTIGTSAGSLSLTANTNTVLHGNTGANNYLQTFGNASGSAPGINVAGVDADIGISVGSKGAGGVALTTNSGVNQVVVLHTAGATRYLTLTGSPGGNPTIGTSAGNLSLNAPVEGSSTITASTHLFASGYAQVKLGTATPAGGAAQTGLFMGSAAIGIYFGSGAPTVAASCIGSLYLRSDGSASTRLYSANSTAGGAGSWSAITSA